MIGNTVYFVNVTHHRYSESKRSVDYEIGSGIVISVDPDTMESSRRKMALKVKGWFSEEIIFANLDSVFNSYDHALMHMNRLILGKN